MTTINKDMEQLKKSFYSRFYAMLNQKPEDVGSVEDELWQWITEHFVPKSQVEKEKLDYLEGFVEWFCRGWKNERDEIVSNPMGIRTQAERYKTQLTERHND